MLKNNLFAIIAGICAASASFFGKLSGESKIAINIYMSILFLIIMVALNALMWTFYSKALKLSTTSIGPTLLSTAVNYMLSGFLGITVFNEKTSLLWWSGISFVIIGLLLITKGNAISSDEKTK